MKADPQPMDVRFRYETRELLQLHQLMQRPMWDGDLIDKAARDELVRFGLVGRAVGWNFLTARAVEMLVQLGYLKASRYETGPAEQSGGGGQ